MTSGHTHLESLELQSNWDFKILVNLTIIPIGETIFGGYQRAPEEKWIKSQFPLAIPISYIQSRSDFSEAKSIYCGEDAADQWEMIKQAAKAYPYAEDENVVSLRKWPNSAYGLPVPGFWTQNNSNTFVREMTALLPGSPSPDIFPNKIHPGNLQAAPVTVPFTNVPSRNPTGPPWAVEAEVANNYIQNQFDNDKWWGWFFKEETDLHINIQ